MQFVEHGMQSNYYSFTEPRKRITINNSLCVKSVCSLFKQSYNVLNIMLLIGITEVLLEDTCYRIYCT